MKKPLQNHLFILFFIFGIGHVFAQTARQQKISAIEKEISEYIADHISTFKITNEDLRQLKKAARFENQTVSGEALQKSLDVYKKYLLRMDYFKLWPEKRNLYATSRK